MPFSVGLVVSHSLCLNGTGESVVRFGLMQLDIVNMSHLDDYAIVRHVQALEAPL